MCYAILVVIIVQFALKPELWWISKCIFDDMIKIHRSICLFYHEIEPFVVFWGTITPISALMFSTAVLYFKRRFFFTYLPEDYSNSVLRGGNASVFNVRWYSYVIWLIQVFAWRRTPFPTFILKQKQQLNCRYCSLNKRYPIRN